MATVLLGWEFGGGLGHVVPLVRIARSLSADGHQPVFVVKDVVESAKVMPRDVPWPLLQAPQWPETAAADGFQAGSFADILARKGYGDETTLRPMLAAWCELLRLLDPKLVIANYAPTLNLAAFGRSCQVVMGTGFTVPPVLEPTFPNLSQQEGTKDHQGETLDCIKRVQRELELPELDSLTDFYATAERFVFTLPELDPYRSVRQGAADGPIDRLPGRTDIPNEKRFYAYLDGSCPNIADVLAALSDAGLHGSVHLKKAPAEMTRALADRGLLIEPTPIDLNERLQEFAMVVHHAGNATAMAALGGGRPQLVLPRFLEQDLTAQSLEQLDVAIALRGSFKVEQLVTSARQMMEDPCTAEAASSVAQAIHDRESYDGLDRLLNHCRSVLSRL